MRTGGCQGLLVSLRTWELQKVRDGGVSQKCSSLATSDSTPSWLSPPSVTAPPLLAVALHTSARVRSLSSASLGGRAGPMFSRPSLDRCPLNRHFKFGWARAQHSGSLPSHLRKQCHRRGHPAALPKPLASVHPPARQVLAISSGQCQAISSLVSLLLLSPLQSAHRGKP